MILMDIKNIDEMKLFGERLGKLLRGGDLVELVGDVGSGKTSLTKGIARGVGVQENIQSPSFTIRRNYSANHGLTFNHYDFYRLNDAGIMNDELVESLNDNSYINVVEWAELVSGVLPSEKLAITIRVVSEMGRKLEIEASGDRPGQILEQIA